MTPAIHKFIRKHPFALRRATRWATIVGAGLLAVQVSFAQTCTGLPGESIIDQSFGSAGNQPSIADRTTYQYVTATCPDNGQYAVASSVNGTCFNNTWHSVPEDHTPGDVAGNLLVVNASDVVGAFYQQPLAGLCGGTRYEFSVWCLNLLRPGICSEPTLPNLTVRIETQTGQVLQTIDFGTVGLEQAPTWRRFAILFTAPTVAEPVVVKLINNQEAGGCGNDLALDDIQLRPCESCPAEPAFLPDAFTPNSDGRNDVLNVFMRPAASFNFRVYNRWGSLLFSSDAPTDAWDGTYAGSPCPVGEYTWVLTYQPAQATPTTGGEALSRPFVKTGRVLLLR